EVGRRRLYVAPSGALGDLKAMLPTLSKNGLLPFAERAPLLAFQFRNCVIGLAFPLVAKPLIAHQRQDVVLVILHGSLAAQTVRRAREVGFELLESELRGSDITRPDRVQNRSGWDRASHFQDGLPLGPCPLIR